MFYRKQNSSFNSVDLNSAGLSSTSKRSRKVSGLDHTSQENFWWARISILFTFNPSQSVVYISTHSALACTFRTHTDVHFYS